MQGMESKKKSTGKAHYLDKSHLRASDQPWRTKELGRPQASNGAFGGVGGWLVGRLWNYLEKAAIGRPLTKTISTQRPPLLINDLWPVP